MFCSLCLIKASVYFEGAELHEADMVLVGAQVDFTLQGCGHVVHVSLAEKGAPHIWTALSLWNTAFVFSAGHPQEILVAKVSNRSLSPHWLVFKRHQFFVNFSWVCIVESVHHMGMNIRVVHRAFPTSRTKAGHHRQRWLDGYLPEADCRRFH